jgi:hypothetical protein
MPILTLDLPADPVPVALGLVLPAGTCELAPAERAPTGLLLSEAASALADWARSQGSLAAVPAGAHAACEGGPKVTPVTVPPGGWAIGLAVPPTEVRADGLPAADIVPLGADRTWWHVPTGAGTVAFVLPDGHAPALFALTPDPGMLPPAGWQVTVPVGEARDAPAQGTPVASVLEPAGVAAAVDLGGKVVVVGLREGTADGQLREGAAAPHAIHASVTPPVHPPVAVAVRQGSARRWTLEAGSVAELRVLDPEVASVTQVGGRGLRVEGLEGGVTTAVLLLDDGRIEVLTVLVGP